MLAAVTPRTLDIAARLDAWAGLLAEAGCSRLLGPATGVVKLLPPLAALREPLPAGDLRELVMAHVLVGSGDWRMALAGNVVPWAAGAAGAVHAQGGCFQPVDALLQPPRVALAELLALYAPEALPAWAPLLAGTGPRTLLLGGAPQLLPGRWLPRELRQFGVAAAPAPLAARDGLLYLPGR